MEKNFALTENAVGLLQNRTIELHCMVNIPNEETPLYYNAADIVLLTSLWEGSPNAVKEAMACDRPIVCTNVGDVEWLFGESKGHYLTDFTPADCASQIEKALKFSKDKGRTDGRNEY